MDPDAALAAFRAALLAWQQAIVSESVDAERQAAGDAIQAAIALDSWLSRGGFLPAAWQANRNHSTTTETEKHMDIALKVSLQPATDQSDDDRQAARAWLAGQIHALTGIAVEDHDDTGGPASAEYEVSAIAFVDE